MQKRDEMCFSYMNFKRRDEILFNWQEKKTYSPEMTEMYRQYCCSIYDLISVNSRADFWECGTFLIVTFKREIFIFFKQKVRADCILLWPSVLKQKYYIQNQIDCWYLSTHKHMIYFVTYIFDFYNWIECII